jgi:uncharacterized protein YecE (DUF72 family)
MAHVYIGTSGWSYKHWTHDVFYPEGLPASRWLEHYARNFETVEINNSFYRLPAVETFKNWAQQVPAGFVFAVKASRYLTHIRRLRDPQEPVDLFFSRARHLGSRLGPVLFQLPPQFKMDAGRMRDLLEALPKKPAQRYVVEVRDRSWLELPILQLLEGFNVALCFADWREIKIDGPVTADFVYLRRHSGPLDGNYRLEDLHRDARQIEKWRRAGRDVYVYFNNDPQGHAVQNALQLKGLLHGKHDPGPNVFRVSFRYKKPA